MSNLILSIIIPTKNRANDLKDTIKSVIDNCKNIQDIAECIIVDNGSTDNTKEVALSFANSKLQVIYEYAPCPGLHVGRNLGAQIARGKYLAYLDDDILLFDGWSDVLLECFEKTGATLIGGPCIPLLENGDKLPEWVEDFKVKAEEGWYIANISVIDLGNISKKVSGNYIFGCNYSIKRDFVLKHGGFPPDLLPQKLLKYIGSGETGMAELVDKYSFTYYDYRVGVYHKVPNSRLTEKYFYSIAKKYAYEDAYKFYRKENKNKNMFLELIKIYYNFVKSIFKAMFNKSFKNKFNLKYFFNKSVQFSRIFFSKKLRKWVLQESYFKEDPCPYWENEFK